MGETGRPISTWPTRPEAAGKQGKRRQPEDRAVDERDDPGRCANPQADYQTTLVTIESMTLAVAAQFPWPDLISWFPKTTRDVFDIYPQLRPEPAILFAADSRWTNPDKSFADGAVKVASIDQFGAATYSGNVLAGEQALASLGRWMQDARLGKSPPDFRHGLRRLWARHAHTGGGLDILFGFFDHAFDPHLFRARNVDDFVIHPVVGPQAIGAISATQFFEAQLRKKIIEDATQPRSQRVTSQNPDDCLSLFQGIIFNAGRMKIDQLVGGPPLGLLVAPSGLRGVSIDIFDPKTGTVIGSSLSKERASEFYDHADRKKLPTGVRWFFQDAK